jgi:heat shock protein HslJ
MRLLFAYLLSLGIGMGFISHPAQAATALSGTQCVLQSIGNLQKLNTAVPLAFDADTVHGSDGCNRLMGTYSVGANNELAMRGEAMAMTRMACIGEGDTISREFAKMLPLIRRYHQTQSQLELQDAQGKILATYTAQDTGLAGTSWQITGLNNGRMGLYSSAALAPFQIRFESSGRLTATLGCLHFAGRFVQRAKQSELSIQAYSKVRTTSAKRCHERQDVKAAQAHFVAAIALVSQYLREGHDLTLRSADGAMQVTATRLGT